MEELNEINAAWANKIASTVLGVEVKKQLETCLSRIQTEAKKNKYSVSVGITIDDLTKAELTKRGFKVKEYEPDHRDPRENGYITISW